jgi:hypothetical protein
MFVKPNCVLFQILPWLQSNSRPDLIIVQDQPRMHTLGYYRRLKLLLEGFNLRRTKRELCSCIVSLVLPRSFESSTPEWSYPFSHLQGYIPIYIYMGIHIIYTYMYIYTYIYILKSLYLSIWNL